MKRHSNHSFVFSKSIVYPNKLLSMVDAQTDEVQLITSEETYYHWFELHLRIVWHRVPLHILDVLEKVPVG